MGPLRIKVTYFNKCLIIYNYYFAFYLYEWILLLFNIFPLLFLCAFQIEFIDLLHLLLPLRLVRTCMIRCRPICIHYYFLGWCSPSQWVQCLTLYAFEDSWSHYRSSSTVSEYFSFSLPSRSLKRHIGQMVDCLDNTLLGFHQSWQAHNR